MFLRRPDTLEARLRIYEIIHFFVQVVKVEQLALRGCLPQVLLRQRRLIIYF